MLRHACDISRGPYVLLRDNSVALCGKCAWAVRLMLLPNRTTTSTRNGYEVVHGCVGFWLLAVNLLKPPAPCR
ncbi:hypothetical protein ZHAS_00004420 [Anopheles sinensis]|uniref:Uncharacterized protein n=1 Tax=Anopheles sinensis TaxID=74873 RepID=A0A084VGW5_ANOSI|nr:hypothetical protein ZHAS_00004420 [Anopheles sinensis]